MYGQPFIFHDNARAFPFVEFYEAEGYDPAKLVFYTGDPNDVGEWLFFSTLPFLNAFLSTGIKGEIQNPSGQKLTTYSAFVDEKWLITFRYERKRLSSILMSALSESERRDFVAFARSGVLR